MASPREFMEVMLRSASDTTLNEVLKSPGMQFLYPVSGLEWVHYTGNCMATIVRTGGNISFDPTKIQGVRYVAPTVDQIVECMDDDAKQKLIDRLGADCHMPDDLDDILREDVTIREELREDAISDTNSPESDHHLPLSVPL